MQTIRDYTKDDGKEFEERDRRAWPILTALVTAGNLGSPLCFGGKRTACASVASPCKLELFSIYLPLDTCLVW